MSLREIRERYDATQSTIARLVNVPLRTYIRYENDESYGDALKRQRIVDIIEDYYKVDEEKGLLSVDKIKEVVSSVIKEGYKNDVEFVYLFGSYSKGYAKETSDVDLCVSTNLTGFNYIGLIENLRVALCKKVDAIRLKDLSNNIELINEIMKDGIRIYG